MKVIIIGGVAGGASAAARLRRLDESCEITIYERGAYISYANCGLPYYIGGEIEDKSDLTLQTPESFFQRFRVVVKTRHEAMLVEPDTKRVLIKNLENGDEFYDRYDKLLVSPGAKPIVPAIDGIGDKRVVTLRTIPDAENILKFVTEQKPRSAVVVGGGYIGLETAENLMRRGLNVTVVEAAAHVLKPFDDDIAADIQNYLRSKGLKIAIDSALKSVSSLDRGLRLTLADDSTIETELLVVSVGVRPDTEFLAGAVERTVRGLIKVDRTMRTSAEDVYAVGDAVEVEEFVLGRPGYLPLAGPANRQGRIAANNIAGIRDEYKATVGTSILKLFDATAAAVGVTEAALKSEQIDYQKVYLWAASHATYYPGAHNMSIKLLFDGSGKIFGAQLFGREGVDKRADVLATAMRAGLTAFDLADLELAYAPPYGSARDPVNVLGFMAENVQTGKVAQFFPEDVKKLDEISDITRLDVRTPAEVKRGIIPGTDHFIPLDELRDRLSELDPAKTVYVNCQSGLRSYVACRILSGNGFNCKNLAGGYRLYASIENNRLFDQPTHPCGAEK